MPSVGAGGTHHVKLDGQYYLVKPGSYIRRQAPQFGARFTTGDPDYNNLSIWQHWAQKCWIGGMDQDEWADDAMYDEGVGVNTWEHDRLTLARDMKKGAGANWAMGGTALERKFFVHTERLYVVLITAAGTNSTIYMWDNVTDGWTLITTFADMVVRSVASFNGNVWLGGMTTAGVTKLIKGTGTPLSVFSVIANPAGVTVAIYAMRSFQQRLYVAYGTKIWRLKTDETWDGNTVFYTADQNSESNYIVSFEVHLGFLYFLSRNGHIHRSDGNATFDIWSWDGQTIGVSLRSFDGRLFVATREFSTDVTSGSFGGLYQLSGSAVTQLKKWGKVGENATLGSLTVFDRKLFYGASNLLGMQAGFGVAIYDPVEDAHSIFASNSDTTTYARGAAPYNNMAVDDVIIFNHRVWASVRGHGIFYVRYTWRDRTRLLADWDITKAGAQLGPQSGGWLTSSLYDAGTPGLTKLWRRITLDYEIPDASCSILVEYSIDGGATYTAGTSFTFGVSGRRHTSFYLNNVKSPSIKLRVTLRSTNSSYTPLVYGWIVSYLPIPEPNWIWTMTLVLSTPQHLVDGTQGTMDTEARLTALQTSYRTKALVSFQDIDQRNWATGGQPGVLIYDIEFRHPLIGSPLEGEVVITLLEAVETY